MSGEPIDPELPPEPEQSAEAAHAQAAEPGPEQSGEAGQAQAAAPAPERGSGEKLTPRPVPTAEEGVALRSRPPIFFFWPTLLLALLFTPLMGFLEDPSPEAAPRSTEEQSPAAGNGEAAAAPVSDQSAGANAWWARRLSRNVSLVLVLVFALVIGLHFAVHLMFFYSRPGLVHALHMWSAKPLVWRLSLMDLFFWVIVVFLVLHPAYGLLTLMSFYAFGMMTEHEMFTRVDRLRRGMFLVIGAAIVAVVLEVLRGAGKEVVWESSAGAGGEMAAFFFAFLAFNMFVLAFDFNGGTLVALICVIVGLAAVVIVCNLTISPKVGEFFVNLMGGLKQLEVNSSFYHAWAFVLATLIVFSGFIAKADFWQITPMAIVHHQGIIVQRTRHYGALANFHYYVEYPDFFESLLGGSSGTFILTLPREERPEVIEHVWYSRHFNRQIQYLLAELPTAEALGGG